MYSQEYWTRIWTINYSEGAGGGLIPAGAQFWLEPITANGKVVCCWIRFEQGKMNECFRDVCLCPVGISDLHCEPLPDWDPGDQCVQAAFSKQALHIKAQGRANSLVSRLEGTCVDPDRRTRSTRLILRLYCFSHAEKHGKSFFVFDIIAEEQAVQNGTAHGDG